LKLEQSDGAPPLPADIQSNQIRVTYPTYTMGTVPGTVAGTGYYTSYITRNLTVPASGIVIFTVPVGADNTYISMTV